MWWVSGSGTIELDVTKAEVAGVCKSGPNDADVLALSQKPHIAKQLEEVDPKVLREYLSEYGAWDEKELEDHEQNLQRLLWNACWDIFDDEG